MLVIGVCATTNRAETIEGRHADRRSEVAITTTAHSDPGELPEPGFGRGSLTELEDPSNE